MTTIEAIITAIGAQAIILLPLYFAHRQKMAAQQATHAEKIAELEAKAEASAAEHGAEFQTKIFEVAKQTVERLSAEVDRLSAEVKRLHDENTRLTARVSDLESELARRVPIADPKP